jgi:hypothetical protein
MTAAPNTATATIAPVFLHVSPRGEVLRFLFCCLFSSSFLCTDSGVGVADPLRLGPGLAVFALLVSIGFLLTEGLGVREVLRSALAAAFNRRPRSSKSFCSDLRGVIVYFQCLSLGPIDYNVRIRIEGCFDLRVRLSYGKGDSEETRER